MHSVMASDKHSRSWHGRLYQKFRRRRAPHGQLQSPLFNRLPPELRDAIYLELWRSAGLSQHIIYHEDFHRNIEPDYYSENGHFCHWPCTTEFDVMDDRQEALQVIRDKIPTPQTETLIFDDQTWNPRLQSRWYNHWRCEETMLEAYKQAGEEEHKLPAFNGPCRAPSKPSPYLPMLLSCKRLYWECARSIYENTTFVFTDVQTARLFTGICGQKKPTPHRPPEPFLHYTRELQLSMTIAFAHLVPCSSKYNSIHTAYDFHWLQLDKMLNCKKLGIWIDVNLREKAIVRGEHFKPMMVFDADTLRRALMSFNPSQQLQVTLSTHLSEEVGPPSGFVTGFSQPNVQIWTRGIGDKFAASDTDDRIWSPPRPLALTFASRPSSSVKRISRLWGLYTTEKRIITY
ncbi:hypothetical protein F5B20DRAFT_205762 [Whalleya microplaca]|nr:hypothetical protein F5B20DRAFT_205762 [Whalleya microplaca]